MLKRFYQVLLFLCAVFLLTGCGSARFSSTLKPSANPELTLDGQRFRLANYTLSFDEDSDPVGIWYKFDPLALTGRARQLYPKIFTDDWTAVPVTVATLGHYEDFSKLGAFLSAMTIGIIPFPSSMGADFQVAVSIVDERGDKIQIPEVKYRREDGMWISLIGPLGCIPVPGQTLLPRDTMFLGINSASFAIKSPTLTTDTLVEAVVSGLRQVPAERLTAIVKARQARMKEIQIEGKPYWSFLVPQFTKGVGQQDKADQFAALLYREQPKPDVQPVESAVIAKRDANGRWQPVTAYLKQTAKGLVSISALLENGAPGRIVVTEVSEPPLEDFVPLPAGAGDDRELAEAMRWSNRILLQAKNRTLPAFLKANPTVDLIDLVTLIENAFLDLNRMAELAKDRAQKAVENGVDAGAARELSLTCRERVDILRPILSAIKQEAAGRGGK